MKVHKAWPQLHVEPVDAFTYRVESESGGSPYFVDMLAMNGKGQCNCKDFECRIAPVLNGNKLAPVNNPMWIAACKHLLRAKIFLAEMVVENVLKQNKFKTQDSP
jgi:hypothetical protein